MKTLNTDVVVIGGGATGAGVLRDLAMRGFDAVMVERADLAQGTSGRFHGLLHSGGRYVISDPYSATECAEENAILRRIHADSVEETGGLFVVGPNDDPEYATRFLAAANETRVPAHELSIKEALTLEPRLNLGIQRAFRRTVRLTVRYGLGLRTADARSLTASRRLRMRTAKFQAVVPTKRPAKRCDQLPRRH